MIVEIVGLMGSGKSSAARALRDTLPDVRQGWRLVRAGYLPWVAGSIPRSLVAARWYRPTGLERPWYVLKLIWHLDAQLSVLARARPSLRGAVLFEEGPIFKLCWISVCAREARLDGPVFERWFRQMLRRCGAVVDRAVWLDAPNAVLLDRIRNRPLLTGYGLKHKPSREAYRLLDLYRSTYGQILGFLASECHLEVTSLRTSEQRPSEVAAALAEYFQPEHILPMPGDPATVPDFR